MIFPGRNYTRSAAPGYDRRSVVSALPNPLRPRFSHFTGTQDDPRTPRLDDRRPPKIVDQEFVPPFW
jgi:hypothetical protein